MKIFAEKLVSTEVDRVCDVCGESVMVENGGHKYAEFGELAASFGYGSAEDGNVYHLDLCESCFKTALYALRDHRRATGMFDDEKDLPDETFGLNPERSTHLQINITLASDFVFTKPSFLRRHTLFGKTVGPWMRAVAPLARQICLGSGF